MGLVELLVGLIAVGVASPWLGRFGLVGYQKFLVQYRKVVAENEAVDASKPIYQSREEELRALVHRQQVAEHTAKAIQSEAALALTEATIEQALSTGDLQLAKSGIQLSLPSAPPQSSPPVQHLREQANMAQHMQAISSLGMQNGNVTPKQYIWGAQPDANPFQGNASGFYLDLLRNGYQRADNGKSAIATDGSERIEVEGELLPPGPVDELEQESA